MTNAESTQANSHTIITVFDDHLPNMTSDHFFCLPNEKNLSKTTTTNFTQQKMANKHNAIFLKLYKIE